MISFLGVSLWAIDLLMFSYSLHYTDADAFNGFGNNALYLRFTLS